MKKSKKTFPERVSVGLRTKVQGKEARLVSLVTGRKKLKTLETQRLPGEPWETESKFLYKSA